MPSPDQIREARHRAGLTQEQAGAVIGASRRTWQNWENGTRNMPGAKWELFNLKMQGEKMSIVTVTFRTNPEHKTTRIRVPDVLEDETGTVLMGRAKMAWIIEKAIEKVFGKTCFWWEDSGLGLHYGQVMQALRPTKRNSNPGNSSVTSRIRVDVE
jgi:DNA-binding XRE family transcriptional regulator